ncbi:wax ester/triacylglycerol synthase domain-containing protein [Lacisediminihabitans sp.]|uniref:wax ester/triacylglycerol synthase domain-containing protein n=1 Tax=Lacisediminihabitans sp. TaxID=2787631 RepID=UPI00374D2859
MSLASDRGSAPMQVGAVLMLDVGQGFEPERLVRAIEQRLPAIPRLRQRLERAPFGCGRPIWVDDAEFRLADHLSIVACLSPPGPASVLDVAAGLITSRLPHDRPLWRASIVTSLGDGGAALVIVYHHVLADGIGGLAVLAALAGAPSEDPLFPRSRPGTAELARDAARDRVCALTRLPSALARLARAALQLGPALRTRPPRSSLNRPTGRRRRFATVACELQRVRETAHGHQATVNDVVLSAITGALRRLLAERGEPSETIVVSVPFSARRTTAASRLGNASGVIPLRLPATGDPDERLDAVAVITRAAKRSGPGASTAMLGPGFRLLARAGLFRRFIDHQRLIQTFVSNLRGPENRLTIGDWPVVSVIPLSVAVGNVTVSFSALSYCGTLTISLAADPDACPDLDRLRQLLEHELVDVTRRRAAGVARDRRRAVG